MDNDKMRARVYWNYARLNALQLSKCQDSDEQAERLTSVLEMLKLAVSHGMRNLADMQAEPDIKSAIKADEVRCFFACEQVHDLPAAVGGWQLPRRERSAQTYWIGVKEKVIKRSIWLLVISWSDCM